MKTLIRLLECGIGSATLTAIVTGLLKIDNFTVDFVLLVVFAGLFLYITKDWTL